MSRTRIYAALLFASSIALSIAAAAQTETERARVLELLHSGRDAIQRGDLAGAEKQFQAAVQAAPTLSDGFLGLGLVQVRRGEMDQAIKSLSRASELNPTLRGPHLFLGIAQYQTGLHRAGGRFSARRDCA